MRWHWELMFCGDDGEELHTFFVGTRTEVTMFADELEDEGFGYIEIFQLDRADED